MASRIKARPLVVEAVRDLVTDDHADCAVVVGRITVQIEEGRLEHRSREVECVHRGQIEGVDRLRSYCPLTTIHQVSKLGQVVVVLKCGGALRVAKRITSYDIESRIVAPALGI